jgi:chromosome segregation ATPase
MGNTEDKEAELEYIYSLKAEINRIEKAFDKQITELKNEISVLDQEIYENKKAITISQEELSQTKTENSLLKCKIDFLTTQRYYSQLFNDD